MRSLAFLCAVVALVALAGADNPGGLWDVDMLLDPQLNPTAPSDMDKLVLNGAPVTTPAEMARFQQLQQQGPPQGMPRFQELAAPSPITGNGNLQVEHNAAGTKITSTITHQVGGGEQQQQQSSGSSGSEQQSSGSSGSEQASSSGSGSGSSGPENGSQSFVDGQGRKHVVTTTTTTTTRRRIPREEMEREEAKDKASEGDENSDSGDDDDDDDGEGESGGSSGSREMKGSPARDEREKEQEERREDEQAEQQDREKEHEQREDEKEQDREEQEQEKEQEEQGGEQQRHGGCKKGKANVHISIGEGGCEGEEEEEEDPEIAEKKKELRKTEHRLKKTQHSFAEEREWMEKAATLVSTLRHKINNVQSHLRMLHREMVVDTARKQEVEGELGGLEREQAAQRSLDRLNEHLKSLDETAGSVRDKVAEIQQQRQEALQKAQALKGELMQLRQRNEYIKQRNANTVIATRAPHGAACPCNMASCYNHPSCAHIRTRAIDFA